MQCSACKLYSCRPLQPSTSDRARDLRMPNSVWNGPALVEARFTIAIIASRRNCPGCDPRPLTCHGCGRTTSCSKCNRVIQCKQCQETVCDLCQGNIFTCIGCNESFCNTCTNFLFVRFVWMLSVLVATLFLKRVTLVNEFTRASIVNVCIQSWTVRFLLFSRVR